MHTHLSIYSAVVLSSFVLKTLSGAEEKFIFLLIGILCGYFVIFYSLVSSVISLDEEKRIICGHNIGKSPYDYRKIFAPLSDGDTAMITGQNIRAVIKETPFFDEIKKLLNKNVNVKIIIAPYNMVCCISDTYKKDFIETIKDLKNFLDDNSNIHKKGKLEIFFHVAAMSLSSIIRMRGGEKRDSMAVFLPKFATDENSAGRIFCVLEQDIHQEYFSILTGIHPSFTQSGAMEFNDVYDFLVRDGQINKKNN